MFRAFARALSQLTDRKTRGILWKSLGGSLVIFIGLWFLVGRFLEGTFLVQWLWLDQIFDLLGWVATLLVTLLLFPAVMSGFIAFFLDDVAKAVEARHYPQLLPAKGISLMNILGTSARFMTVLVVMNLLLLPFLLIPPIFPFVFYAVNGYLLSREYFELVALRRLAPGGVGAVRKAHRGRLFLAGVVIAFLMTIPVVNLLAPILATAVMVHLFEAWRPNEAAAGIIKSGEAIEN